MRNKRRRGKLRVKKLLVCLFLAIAIIAVLVMLIGKGISTIRSRVEATASTPPVYTLFVGTDSRYGSQADLVLLTAVNEGKKEMTVLSLPPNTRISPKDQKNLLLKDAYEGSTEEIRSAVENLLHIRIQHYAVVDTANFTDYVKELGPVDFFVEKDMAHSDAEGNPDIAMREGYQTMDAEKALAYLRYIDRDNGEIGRVQRQERLFKAFVQKAKDHWPVILWWMGRQHWSAVDTDISPTAAASALYHLKDYPDSNIHFLILPGETEQVEKVDTWIVNPVEVQKVIAVTME